MASSMEQNRAEDSGNIACITPSPARPFVTNSAEAASLLSAPIPQNRTTRTSPSNPLSEQLQIGLKYENLNSAMSVIQRLNYMHFHGQRRLQVQAVVTDNRSARLVCEYHPWCKFYILLEQIQNGPQYQITEVDLCHHTLCDSLLQESQQGSTCSSSIGLAHGVTPAASHQHEQNYLISQDESCGMLETLYINNLATYTQPLDQFNPHEQRISPVGTTFSRDEKYTEDAFIVSSDIHQLYKNNVNTQYYPDNTGNTGFTAQPLPRSFNKARPLISPPQHVAVNDTCSSVTPVATPAMSRTPVTVIRHNDNASAYNLTTEMRWDTAKDAARAIYNYASHVQKKRTRMDKKSSGGRNKKYVCACPSCGWFVRLLKVMKTEQWKISSMQLQHSVSCIADHTGNNGIVSGLQHSLNTPVMTPKTPAHNHNRNGDLSQTISINDDPVSRSFGAILHAFGSKYADSVIAIKRDEQQGQLLNVCVVPEWIRKSLHLFQCVYGLEIIPCSPPRSSSNDLKSRFGSRFFICMIGKDGNLEPHLLSLGFVEAITDENMQWYFQELEMAGFTLNETTIFTGYGFQNVLNGLRRVFPKVKPQLCSDSLLITIQNDLGLALSPEQLLIIREQIQFARNAANVGHFQECLNVIASINPNVAAYLQQINPSDWTIFVNHGMRTYRWTSTCFNEYLEMIQAENSDTLDRHPALSREILPLLDTFEILKRLIADACNRQNARVLILQRMKEEQARFLQNISMESVKDEVNPHILARALQLTPNATRIIEKEMTDSSQFHVQSVEAGVAFVYSPTENQCAHRINLNDVTCSCGLTYQLGLPCRHLIAGAKAMYSLPAIRIAVEHIYTMETYTATCIPSQCAADIGVKDEENHDSGSEDEDDAKAAKDKRLKRSSEAIENDACTKKVAKRETEDSALTSK